ncbi:MAG: hypothetical protein R2734_13680 [Nocardioides sp.]
MTELLPLLAGELRQTPSDGWTALPELALLCLEHPGTWGRHAVADSRLPEPVRQRLAELAVCGRCPADPSARLLGDGAGACSPPGEASRPGRSSRSCCDVEELLELPLERLATGHGLGLPAYATAWLAGVCTNGRRDLCCSERVGYRRRTRWPHGWPDAPVETTHLGGHRFAATLLAPLQRGRPGPARPGGRRRRGRGAGSRTAAARPHPRPSAGRSPAAQVAELRCAYADSGRAGAGRGAHGGGGRVRRAARRDGRAVARARDPGRRGAPAPELWRRGRREADDALAGRRSPGHRLRPWTRDLP